MVKEIAREIERMSGTYSGYEIFSDWVKAFALSIANFTEMQHGKIWEEREKQYLSIVQKYGKEQMQNFCKLNAMLVEAMEENIEDVLGSVYMEANLGSKQLGQFFTPFHLSSLTANLCLPKEVSKDKPMVINEPSAGGGGMIIGIVKALRERGINPQECMDVVAQDLDWKAVYMTYVQLSILGIKATVIQGNTLSGECMDVHTCQKERVLYTPARKGMIF